MLFIHTRIYIIISTFVHMYVISWMYLFIAHILFIGIYVYVYPI